MVGMIGRYGMLGLFRLALDAIYTRLWYRGARLVRRPIYVRGRRHIKIGKDFTTGVGLRLDAFPAAEAGESCIRIGERVQLNDYVHIGAVESVVIGNDVLIASKVFITDHNHGRYAGDCEHDSPDTAPAARGLVSSPVVIEDNVWIGEFVVVLPGVRIGRGAVIGAMSVVTHDIPAGTIAVGAPARVIKKYDSVGRRWVKMKES